MRAIVPGVAASIIASTSSKSRVLAVVRVGHVEVVVVARSSAGSKARIRTTSASGARRRRSRVVRGVHGEQQVGRVVGSRTTRAVICCTRCALPSYPCRRSTATERGSAPLADVPAADAGGVDDDRVAEAGALDGVAQHDLARWASGRCCRSRRR